MKLAESTETMQSLFDAPSPATLTLYRADGSAMVSPVWFRLAEDTFEVVVARADPKVDLLRHDARGILLIFEAVPPFRGVRVSDSVTLEPDVGAEVRLAIASRYLGPDRGAAYADVAHREPGFVVRWPIASARAWDLADKLA